MKPLHDRQTTAIHVAVPGAANILSVTADAVRFRLRRGKLRRERHADGAVSIPWGNCDYCEYMACFRFRFTLGRLCLVIRLVTMRVAVGVPEASLNGSAAPGAAAYATA
jgi:hypothetical protein